MLYVDDAPRQNFTQITKRTQARKSVIFYWKYISSRLGEQISGPRLSRISIMRLLSK